MSNVTTENEYGGRVFSQMDKQLLSFYVTTSAKTIRVSAVRLNPASLFSINATTGYIRF